MRGRKRVNRFAGFHQNINVLVSHAHVPGIADAERVHGVTGYCIVPRASLPEIPCINRMRCLIMVCSIGCGGSGNDEPELMFSTLAKVCSRVVSKAIHRRTDCPSTNKDNCGIFR